MSAATIALAEAQAAGIRFRLAGGRVMATVPNPPEAAEPILTRLRAHKVEVTLLLTGPPQACTCCMGGGYWLTGWLGWVCVRCHPPATPGEKARPVRRVVGWIPVGLEIKQ